MFDINTLEINDTADMPVKNAAGEKQYADGKLLTITVHGPASKTYQQIKHLNEQENTTRLMAKMQGKEDPELSLEEKAAKRADQLAKVTSSFNGFGSGDLTGYQLFKSVYGNPRLGHIADDLEKFVNNRASFTNPSTTN